MNDSDTEFIAQEEITRAASTQDTSLTTSEGDFHVVPNDNQSKKKKKNKKEELWKRTKKFKGYQARRVSPRVRNTTQSKWNSFPNKIFLFGDKARKAARTDSWTIKLLCSSEWKKT